ncbi:microtubule-associated protein futsch-like isoform X2 [Ptychodera flava]
MEEIQNIERQQRERFMAARSAQMAGESGRGSSRTSGESHGQSEASPQRGGYERREHNFDSYEPRAREFNNHGQGYELPPRFQRLTGQTHRPAYVPFQKNYDGGSNRGQRDYRQQSNYSSKGKPNAKQAGYQGNQPSQQHGSQSQTHNSYSQRKTPAQDHEQSRGKEHWPGLETSSKQAYSKPNRYTTQKQYQSSEREETLDQYSTSKSSHNPGKSHSQTKTNPEKKPPADDHRSYAYFAQKGKTQKPSSRPSTETNKSRYGQTVTLEVERLPSGNVLCLLRGLPGSGKSTLARHLVGNGIILSTDEFFITDGKYEYEFDKLGEAHEWNKIRAKQAMEEWKTPIIIDNTNCQFWEMKPYVALAINYDYTVIIREPKTPWKYKVKELAQRNSHGVTAGKIKQMLERYDNNVTAEYLLAAVDVVKAKHSSVETKKQEKSAKSISSNSDTNGTKRKNKEDDAAIEHEVGASAKQLDKNAGDKEGEMKTSKAADEQDGSSVNENNDSLSNEKEDITEKKDGSSISERDDSPDNKKDEGLLKEESDASNESNQQSAASAANDAERKTSAKKKKKKKKKKQQKQDVAVVAEPEDASEAKDEEKKPEDALAEEKRQDVAVVAEPEDASEAKDEAKKPEDAPAEEKQDEVETETKQEAAEGTKKKKKKKKKKKAQKDAPVEGTEDNDGALMPFNGGIYGTCSHSRKDQNLHLQTEDFNINSATNFGGVYYNKVNWEFKPDVWKDEENKSTAVESWESEPSEWTESKQAREKDGRSRPQAQKAIMDREYGDQIDTWGKKSSVEIVEIDSADVESGKEISSSGRNKARNSGAESDDEESANDFPKKSKKKGRKKKKSTEQASVNDRSLAIRKLAAMQDEDDMFPFTLNIRPVVIRTSDLLYKQIAEGKVEEPHKEEEDLIDMKRIAEQILMKPEDISAAKKAADVGAEKSESNLSEKPQDKSIDKETEQKTVMSTVKTQDISAEKEADSKTDVNSVKPKDNSIPKASDQTQITADAVKKESVTTDSAVEKTQNKSVLKEIAYVPSKSPGNIEPKDIRHQISHSPDPFKSTSVTPRQEDNSTNQLLNPRQSQDGPSVGNGMTTVAKPSSVCTKTQKPFFGPEKPAALLERERMKQSANISKYTFNQPRTHRRPISFILCEEGGRFMPVFGSDNIINTFLSYEKDDEQRKQRLDESKRRLREMELVSKIPEEKDKKNSADVKSKAGKASKVKLAPTFGDSSSANNQDEDDANLGISDAELLSIFDDSKKKAHDASTNTYDEEFEFVQSLKADSVDETKYPDLKVVDAQGDRFTYNPTELFRATGESMASLRLHKSTTTEDFPYGVNREDNIKFLYRNFSKVTFEGVKEVLTQCDGDVDWAVDIMLEIEHCMFRDKMDLKDFLLREKLRLMRKYMKMERTIEVASSSGINRIKYKGKTPLDFDTTQKDSFEREKSKDKEGSQKIKQSDGTVADQLKTEDPKKDKVQGNAEDDSLDSKVDDARKKEEDENSAKGKSANTYQQGESQVTAEGNETHEPMVRVEKEEREVVACQNEENGSPEEDMQATSAQTERVLDDQDCKFEFSPEDEIRFDLPSEDVVRKMKSLLAEEAASPGENVEDCINADSVRDMPPLFAERRRAWRQSLEDRRNLEFERDMKYFVEEIIKEQMWHESQEEAKRLNQSADDGDEIYFSTEEDITDEMSSGDAVAEHPVSERYLTPDQELEDLDETENKIDLVSSKPVAGDCTENKSTSDSTSDPEVKTAAVGIIDKDEDIDKQKGLSVADEVSECDVALEVLECGDSKQTDVECEDKDARNKSEEEVEKSHECEKGARDKAPKDDIPIDASSEQSVDVAVKSDLSEQQGELALTNKPITVDQDDQKPAEGECVTQQKASDEVTAEEGVTDDPDDQGGKQELEVTTQEKDISIPQGSETGEEPNIEECIVEDIKSEVSVDCTGNSNDPDSELSPALDSGGTVPAEAQTNVLTGDLTKEDQDIESTERKMVTSVDGTSLDELNDFHADIPHSSADEEQEDIVTDDSEDQNDEIPAARDYQLSFKELNWFRPPETDTATEESDLFPEEGHAREDLRKSVPGLDAPDHQKRDSAQVATEKPGASDSKTKDLPAKDSGIQGAGSNEKKKSQGIKEKKSRDLSDSPSSIMSDQYLQMPMDPILALQLEEMFGPVRMHPSALSAGLFPHEDYIVNINYDLAKQIYQCWVQTLKKKADSYQKEMEEILKADEALARELQKEEEEKMKGKKSRKSGKRDNSTSSSQSSSRSSSPRGKRYTPLQTNTAVDQSPPKPYYPPQGAESLKEIMDEQMALQISENDRTAARAEARGPANLSGKLKREKLKSMFPKLDPEALDEIFEANNYKLEPTVQLIRASLGLLFGPDTSITSNANTTASTSSSTAATAKGKTSVPIPPEARQLLLGAGEGSALDEDWEEDEEAYQTMSDPDYRDFRAEADTHYKLRHECFQKAAEAYKRGQRQLALVYSQQGHMHTTKLRDANKRASEKILQRRSASLDENTLDLHGLHVPEALDALEKVLKQKEAEVRNLQSRRRFTHLNVVTGSGTHSRGGVARIRPCVIDWLKRNDYQYTEQSTAVLKVLLK